MSDQEQNILVIYDQLNAELQYRVTTDEEFLELNGAILNGSTTPQEIQDKLWNKIFTEDGENKLDWTILSSISSELVKSIDRIVTIACLP